MSLVSGNLNAIAYRLEKGEDNGGIERDALAEFLRRVADSIIDAEEARVQETARCLNVLATVATIHDVRPNTPAFDTLQDAMNTIGRKRVEKKTVLVFGDEKFELE